MFLEVLTLAIIEHSTIENTISFTLKCSYCFQEQIWIIGNNLERMFLSR